MSHDTLLYHDQRIRSRFLEAEAYLDEVLSEAASAGASDSLAARFDRARTLALAAYDDYSVIRKRLIAAVSAATPLVG